MKLLTGTMKENNFFGSKWKCKKNSSTFDLKYCFSKKKKKTQTNQAVHRIQIPAVLLMINSKQRINTSLNDYKTSLDREIDMSHKSYFHFLKFFHGGILKFLQDSMKLPVDSRNFSRDSFSRVLQGFQELLVAL